MRLWLQSAANLEADPRWHAYERQLLDHARAISRPGTAVELHGASVMVPELDYPYVQYLHTREFIEAGLAAQRSGFSAFVLNCWDDPGLDEIRSLLDIPVTSIGESAMHLATIVGDRFGLVPRNERVGAKVVRNAAAYGLGGKLVGPVYCRVSLPDLGQAFAEPGPIIARFTQAAREVIATGAEVILPACGVLSLLLRVNKIVSVDEAPVVDGTAAALKLAETMVDLWASGLGWARRTRYARPPAAALDRIRAVYGQSGSGERADGPRASKA